MSAEIDVPPTIQELVSVHAVHQLDEILDDISDLTDIDEEKFNSIIRSTLNVIQSKFYLVPKLQIADNDSLVIREAPNDTIVELLSELYLNTHS